MLLLNWTIPFRAMGGSSSRAPAAERGPKAPDSRTIGFVAQETDVKPDETGKKWKPFTDVKDMYKPLISRWKGKLAGSIDSGAMKETDAKIK